MSKNGPEPFEWRICPNCRQEYPSTLPGRHLCPGEEFVPRHTRLILDPKTARALARAEIATQAGNIDHRLDAADLEARRAAQDEERARLEAHREEKRAEIAAAAARREEIMEAARQQIAAERDPHIAVTVMPAARPGPEPVSLTTHAQRAEG